MLKDVTARRPAPQLDRAPGFLETSQEGWGWELTLQDPGTGVRPWHRTSWERQALVPSLGLPGPQVKFIQMAGGKCASLKNKTNKYIYDIYIYHKVWAGIYQSWTPIIPHFHEDSPWDSTVPCTPAPLLSKMTHNEGQSVTELTGILSQKEPFPTTVLGVLWRLKLF